MRVFKSKIAVVNGYFVKSVILTNGSGNMFGKLHRKFPIQKQLNYTYELLRPLIKPHP